MRLATICGASILGLASLSPAFATPVTYSFFGITSGSLNGVAFNDSETALSLTTDTDQIHHPQGRPDIFVVGTAPIEFAVNSTAGFFNDSFSAVADNSRSTFAFTDGPGNALLEISDPSLQNYDLSIGYGLFTQVPPSFISLGQVFATSAGDLVFSADPNTRFIFLTSEGIASPVPEPASWMLLVFGFGIVGSLVRQLRTRVTTAPA